MLPWSSTDLRAPGLRADPLWVCLPCSGNSAVPGFNEGTAAQYSPAAEGNRDLSTSVLQVRSQLLVQPVLGEIDAARLRQLTQQLLDEIHRRRARVVVIDMTGVPAVNPGAVKGLVQAAAAARLMGAKVIITGLSPEIAKELAPFGADLRAVTAAADLQGALEDAERLLGGHPTVLQSAERRFARST